MGESYEGYERWAMLPPFVAYGRDLLEKCIMAWPDEQIGFIGSNGRIMNCTMYFHHFPFLYDMHDRVHEYEYVTVPD
jgi:hypothetical protein